MAPDSARASSSPVRNRTSCLTAGRLHHCGSAVRLRGRVEYEDHVSGFVLGFDVPSCLDHILQRVAPVDDGPVPPRLDELLQKVDVLLRPSRWYLENHLLVSEPRRPHRQDQIVKTVACQVS